MSVSRQYDFATFTERGYEELLDLAARFYRFEPFGTECDAAHALWRHDVDISVHRALFCARAEHKRDLRATYFFMISSEFYNIFESPIRAIVQEIAGLGHWIGLHFDPIIYSDCRDMPSLERRVLAEKSAIEQLLDVRISALSYHRPTISDILRFDDDFIAGIANAYAQKLKTQYDYMSDSNGYWRFQNVPKLLGTAERPRFLHLLTHPEWWTQNTLSPRDRVERAIQGRAHHVAALYDADLALYGRTNVR